jgi:hypothetical protein
VAALLPGSRCAIALEGRRDLTGYTFVIFEVSQTPDSLT